VVRCQAAGLEAIFPELITFLILWFGPILGKGQQRENNDRGTKKKLKGTVSTGENKSDLVGH